MKHVIIACTLLLFLGGANAQKVISIWPGAAPGSESWNWSEQEDSSEIPHDPLAYNIVLPTLTFFPADQPVSPGTTAIICPGGSFCYLHIETEGEQVAKWLNKKGISAFVLKYRVVRSQTQYPLKEKTERMKDTGNLGKLVRPIVSLAIADARQAIAYVRSHAMEFGIDPNRIGIIGFSAGGALAISSAFGYTADNRPDFVAPIYAYVPPSLSMNILKDAPPIFIAAATDDELHLVPMSVALYSKWLAAGYSAELHIYSKGGHGFGMNKRGQPSDTWIERFYEWLQAQPLFNNNIRLE